MSRFCAAKNALISGATAFFSSISIHSSRSRRIYRAALALACVGSVLIWTGCIASSSSNSEPLVISANNGSLQSTVVSTAFGAPLVAVATKGGKPSSGVSVTFTAPSSGASGTFANGTATDTETTNSSGLATSAKFTANSTDGTYNVTATSSGAQGSATFSLTNLAAAALTISAQNGSAQSTLADTTFPTPFSVVVDQNGSPIEGVSVTFTAPSSSGASGTFSGGASTDTVTTDKNGQATSSTFTANGNSGQYNVLATVVGGSAPAQFSLNNLSTSSLTVVEAGVVQQSAAVGTAFGSTLQVGVYNQGTGVQGVSVTFTVQPGQSGASGTFNKSVTIETDVTNSSGIATSSTLTANQTIGSFQVVGAVSGNTTQVDFGLTNTSSLTVSMGSGDGQTTQVGTEFGAPLVAHVVDSQNNVVSGVTVTFTAPTSGAGGSFSGTSSGVTIETVQTDSYGNASTPFYANTTVGGPYQVVATVSGATGSATFNLTNSTSAVAGVVPTGGIIQRAAVNKTFNNFVATVVDHNGKPLSGQPVTFSVLPSTGGASGTFASNSSGTETDTTDSNGNAKSSVFSANGTSGSYTVTASSGSVTGTFHLMNTADAVTSYTFYASGQSQPHSGGTTTNYYAIAGAIIVDQVTGAVIGGEEDYNDANGYTYVNVPVTGGTLSANSSTGQGTLSLSVPSEQTLGNAGTETFGVQFVNTNHALIMQWDASATSSGSMDVQDLTSAASGAYAFTFSGTDPNYAPIGLGGVFAFTGNLLYPQWGMTLDVNDPSSPIIQGATMPVTISSVDTYGRGQIQGVSIPVQPAINLTLYYYLTGAEVLRVIDMDTTIAAVGSAFGQGVNATSGGNTALGESVFAITGSPSMGNPSSTTSNNYAAVGQFTADGSGNISTGVADEKQLTNNQITAQPITGTYNVGSSGYGTLTIASGQLGSVSAMGLYLTDPNLNLNDPSNTTSGLGGALLLDLDTSLSSGTGLIVPQTDTATSSFSGNYAVGWQDPNHFKSCYACEFDILAQGSMAVGGAFSLIGLVSDPFGTLVGTEPTPSGVTFSSSQPQADLSNPGRWTMLSGTLPKTDLVMEIPITGTSPYTREFDVTVYQASGGQLFWLEVDSDATNSDGSFFGPVEQQGSLNGIPILRSGSGKTHEKKPRSQTGVASRGTI